jgi:hypothetical protein
LLILPITGEKYFMNRLPEQVIMTRQGNLVSLELLDASHRVEEARKIEFETVS